LQEADAADAEAPQLRRVRMYTFGAPRVGNSEFARFFDALGMEAFRIVNGADIVARMPRYPLTSAHAC
jgi:predicted lipase